LKKFALVDARNSGVSGDMFVAALLDLGADEQRLKDVLDSLKPHIGEFKVEIGRVEKCGIAAARYVFSSKEEEMPYPKAKKAISSSNLGSGAKDFALRCLDELCRAEAKVHGTKKGKVMLHDAKDSVGDFVACAACLEDLGLSGARFFSTPVNVGRGLFSFHGKELPVPSPAVCEILKGVPVFGDLDGELTTPTGAAILKSLECDFSEDLPMVKIDGVGYGAGTYDLPRPNVLRIMTCEGREDLIPEPISLLETNIDDSSGETLGYAMERLLEEGAKDVCILPCTMKKARPGNVLRVICAFEDSQRLARVIMEETGTLGVRVMPIAHRYVLRREVVRKEVEFEGRCYGVRFKVAKDAKGEVLKTAPEFEDVKRIAKEAGKSIREVRAFLEGQL